MPTMRSRPSDHAADRRPRHQPSATAAEHLCDTHSAALFSLALALTGDRVRAEGVVVDVISAACSMLSLPDVELRHELSRRTYRRCTAAGPGHASTVGTEEGRQRAALSLVRFGGLDYCETAAVLGLPSPEVARLLNSGLHELVLTPEHPRP